MSSTLRIPPHLLRRDRPSAVPPSTPIRPSRPTRFPVPVYTPGDMSPDGQIAALRCKDVFGLETPAPRLSAFTGKLRSILTKPTVAPTLPTTPARTHPVIIPLSYPVATSTPVRPRLTPRPFLAPVRPANDISPDAKATRPARGKDIFGFDTPAKPRVDVGPSRTYKPEVVALAANVASPAKPIVGSSSSWDNFVREENKKAAQRWRDKEAAREASRAAALPSAPSTTTTTTPPSTPPAAPVQRPSAAKPARAASSHVPSTTTTTTPPSTPPAPPVQRTYVAKPARASSSPARSTSTTTTPPSTPPAPVQRLSPAKPARATPASVTPARLPSTSSTDKKKARASKVLFEVTEQFLRTYSSEDEKSSTDDVAASDMVKLAVEGLMENGAVDKIDIRHLIAVLQPFADNNNRTDSEHITRRSTAKPKSILKPTFAGKTGPTTKPRLQVHFAGKAHVKLYKP